MWLLKINTVGDTLWTRHYGGPGHQHCYATRQTSDGGFIAVGQSRSYSMNMEIMFVKLDPLGNLVPSAVSELASDNMILNIYPNPTEGDIHIDLSNAVNPGSTLKITNSLGQILFSETIDQSSGTKNKAINLENKKPGIYFVTIQSNDNITTRKLVLY
jgi:hypothetical protein